MDLPELYKGEEAYGFHVPSGQNWVYPTNYTERKYQFDIVKSALFENTLVSLPTGLGKTFIAAVVMYNYYRWYPQGKIVFTAPTKPLVNQQIDSCFKVVGIPREDTVEMTGTMPPNTRQSMWQTKRVIFGTPQTITNDLTSGICPSEFIRCIIIDEAHRALKQYHFCQMVRAVAAQNKCFRILALSATPGSNFEAIKQVVQNLLISRIEVRTEDSPDISPFTHKRNVETILVKTNEELRRCVDRFSSIIDIFTRQLRSHKLINSSMLSKYGFVQAQQRFMQNPPCGLSPNVQGLLRSDFAICISLSHAKDMLESSGLRAFYNVMESLRTNPNKKTIVTRLECCVEFQHLITEIRERIETEDVNKHDPNISVINPSQMAEGPHYIGTHSKMERVRDIVMEHFTRFQEKNASTKAIIFCEFRETVDEVGFILNQLRPLVRARIFVGQSDTKNSKGLKQNMQKKIIGQFRDGHTNTLVATCVGEEGLDIGEVDLIICYDVVSHTRLVQRMGRTGRLREGRIVHLVMEGKEEAKYKAAVKQNVNINKKLIQQNNILQPFLYRQNPRMFPHGMPQPECNKILITPQQDTDVSKTSKNQDLRVLFKSKGTKKNRKSIENQDENIEKLNNLFYGENPLDKWDMLPEKYILCTRTYEEILDHQSKSNLFGCTEKKQINLNEYLDWQRLIQGGPSTSHSMDTNILVDLLAYAEKMYSGDLNSTVTMAASQIDVQKIIAPKKKPVKRNNKGGAATKQSRSKKKGISTKTAPLVKGLAATENTTPTKFSKSDMRNYLWGSQQPSVSGIQNVKKTATVIQPKVKDPKSNINDVNDFNNDVNLNQEMDLDMSPKSKSEWENIPNEFPYVEKYLSAANPTWKQSIQSYKAIGRCTCSRGLGECVSLSESRPQITKTNDEKVLEIEQWMKEYYITENYDQLPNQYKDAKSNINFGSSIIGIDGLGSNTAMYVEKQPNFDLGLENLLEIEEEMQLQLPVDCAPDLLNENKKEMSKNQHFTIPCHKSSVWKETEGVPLGLKEEIMCIKTEVVPLDIKEEIVCIKTEVMPQVVNEEIECIKTPERLIAHGRPACAQRLSPVITSKLHRDTVLNVKTVLPSIESLPNSQDNKSTVQPIANSGEAKVVGSPVITSQRHKKLKRLKLKLNKSLKLSDHGQSSMGQNTNKLPSNNCMQNYAKSLFDGVSDSARHYQDKPQLNIPNARNINHDTFSENALKVISPILCSAKNKVKKKLNMNVASAPTELGLSTTQHQTDKTLVYCDTNVKISSQYNLNRNVCVSPILDKPSHIAGKHFESLSLLKPIPINTAGSPILESSNQTPRSDELKPCGIVSSTPKQYKMSLFASSTPENEKLDSHVHYSSHTPNALNINQSKEVKFHSSVHMNHSILSAIPEESTCSVTGESKQIPVSQIGTINANKPAIIPEVTFDIFDATELFDRFSDDETKVDVSPAKIDKSQSEQDKDKWKGQCIAQVLQNTCEESMYTLDQMLAKMEVPKQSASVSNLSCPKSPSSNSRHKKLSLKNSLQNDVFQKQDSDCINKGFESDIDLFASDDEWDHHCPVTSSPGGSYSDQKKKMIKKNLAKCSAVKVDEINLNVDSSKENIDVIELSSDDECNDPYNLNNYSEKCAIDPVGNNFVNLVTPSKEDNLFIICEAPKHVHCIVPSHASTRDSTDVCTKVENDKRENLPFIEVSGNAIQPTKQKSTPLIEVSGHAIQPTKQKSTLSLKHKVNLSVGIKNDSKAKNEVTLSHLPQNCESSNFKMAKCATANLCSNFREAISETNKVNHSKDQQSIPDKLQKVKRSLLFDLEDDTQELWMLAAEKLDQMSAEFNSPAQVVDKDILEEHSPELVTKVKVTPQHSHSKTLSTSYVQSIETSGKGSHGTTLTHMHGEDIVNKSKSVCNTAVDSPILVKRKLKVMANISTSSEESVPPLKFVKDANLACTSDTKSIASDIQATTSGLKLSQNSFSADDDFDETTTRKACNANQGKKNSKRKEIPIKRQKIKDNCRVRKDCEFISNEAEESFIDHRNSTDGENTSGLDEYDDSFVEDEITEPTMTQSIQTKYIHSKIKSPDVNWRRPPPKVNFSAVFSQVDVNTDDNSYLNDSFVNDESLEDQEPSEMSILELAEAQLREKRKKKSNKRKRQQMHESVQSISSDDSQTENQIKMFQNKKRRRIKTFDSSDSEENVGKSEHHKDFERNLGNTVSSNIKNVSRVDQKSENINLNIPCTNNINIPEISKVNIDKSCYEELLDISDIQFDFDEFVIEEQSKCDSHNSSQNFKVPSCQTNLDIGKNSKLSAVNRQTSNVCNSRITHNMITARIEEVKPCKASSRVQRTLVVAQRQVAVASTIVSVLRSQYDIQIWTKPLQEADFIVSWRGGVARVSLSEFSSNDTRSLERTINNLRSTFQIPYLIVENDKQKELCNSAGGKTVMWLTKQIPVKLMHLRELVTILFSSNSNDTARILAQLVDKEVNLGHQIQFCPTNVMEQINNQVQFYYSLPGVNYANALRLQGLFMCPTSFINSTVDVIRSTAGIAKETAAQIKLLLKRQCLKSCQ